MKKIASGTLGILLLLVIFCPLAIADTKCTVSLDVDFPGNLIFSKYNVDVYVNSQKIETISHGKDYVGTFYTYKDYYYTLYFYKPDNKKVQGKIDFYVKGDTKISCRISCHSDRIDVTNVSIKYDESKDTTPTPQPTPAITNKIEQAKSEPAMTTERPEETSLVRSMPSMIDSFNMGTEANSWLLSYNHMTDTSKKIVLHAKNGQETVFVGHYLPAGEYHIENRGSAPAQIKFYRDGIEQNAGAEVLIQSEKESVNLFSGDETEFTLQNGEYIILADGSADLYCEPQ